MEHGVTDAAIRHAPIPPFERKVRESTGAPLAPAERIDVLQVNTGLLCNQECFHCHVESSPLRKEMMSWPTMEAVLRLAARSACRLVDITGGAPELHPHFERFVTALVDAGHAVQVRTNLTVLVLPRSRGLIDFMKSHGVRLVASLPCYLEENVERQRGTGVFASSIEAIARLNEAGYGIDPELPLNLVYNPVGPSLPPAQDALEADYREQLLERHGIRFTNLFTITNMPIGRFLEDLVEQGRDEHYLRTLERSFNHGTVDGLMCRHQVSVRWDGVLFDCDFNLALGIPARSGGRDVESIDPDAYVSRRIATAEHCYGCTAGAGSSCGGAIEV